MIITTYLRAFMLPDANRHKQTRHNQGDRKRPVTFKQNSFRVGPCRKTARLEGTRHWPIFRRSILLLCLSWLVGSGKIAIAQPDPSPLIDLDRTESEARYRYSLAQAFEVKVPLSSQSALQVTLKVLPSQALEIRGVTFKQLFPLKTIRPDIPPEFRASVLVDDFNFDGWFDLAIPVSIGDTNGNITYAVHLFNPTQQRFTEPTQGANPWLLDNLTLDLNQKRLLTWSRSGKFGSGHIYQFANGQPWLYRTRSSLDLFGFAPTEETIYDLREFTPQGKQTRQALSESATEFKSVQRQIRQNRLVIYGSPHSPLLKRYLMQGTIVTIHEINLTANDLWIRVSDTKALTGFARVWIKSE